MKRSFNTLLLILAYLLFSAKSCNDREQRNIESEQINEKSTIEGLTSILCSDSLTSVNLRAFEEMAENHLSDFWDYIHIVADSATAPEFKLQTKRIILQLFIGEDANMHMQLQKRENFQEIRLSRLLDDQSQLTSYTKGMVADSVWIGKHLQKSSDTSFSGKLCFSFHQDNNSFKSSVKKGEVVFYLIKRNKYFGRERLNVWTVLLGDLELNFF